MSQSICCPYCNTAFTLDAVSPDRRAVCPRCGDAFPLPHDVEPGDDLAGPPGVAPAGARIESEVAGPQGGGVPIVRVLIFSVLLLVVGFALGMYLIDKPIKPQVPGSANSLTASGFHVTPPGKLEGLKYLRPDTNVLFAVQPGALIGYAAETNQDPKAILMAAGMPRGVLELLDRAGLKLEQIDHITGGLAVGDAVAELRFTLTLVLKQPLADEERFLRAFEARRITQGGRTLQVVNLAGRPGVLAWQASPKVWVFAANEDDLPPTAGGTGPTSTTLLDMISTRLSPATSTWAAMDEGRWSEKPGVQLAALLLQKKDWLATLAKGRAAVVGLSFEPSPRLRIFVHAADTETGDLLRAYFQKLSGIEGVQSGGAGEWAMLDLPIDPKDATGPLKKFLDDASGK